MAEIVSKMENEVLSSPTGPYADKVRSSWFAREKMARSGPSIEEWRESVLQTAQVSLNESEVNLMASVAEEGGFSIGEIPEQLKRGTAVLYRYVLDGVNFSVSTGEFLDHWRSSFARPVFKNKRGVVDHIELLVWKEVNRREAVRVGVPLMPLFLEEKAGFQRYQILEQCRWAWKKPSEDLGTVVREHYLVPSGVISGLPPVPESEIQGSSAGFVEFESEAALIQALIDRGEILADLSQSTIDSLYATEPVE